MVVITAQRFLTDSQSVGRWGDFMDGQGARRERKNVRAAWRVYSHLTTGEA